MLRDAEVLFEFIGDRDILDVAEEVRDLRTFESVGDIVLDELTVDDELRLDEADDV